MPNSKKNLVLIMALKLFYLSGVKATTTALDTAQMIT